MKKKYGVFLVFAALLLILISCEPVTETKIQNNPIPTYYHGLGFAADTRLNTVSAYAIFDQNGKIISIMIDINEIGNNYNLGTAPVPPAETIPAYVRSGFKGWPGQGTAAEVSGGEWDGTGTPTANSVVNSEASFLAQVDKWVTKRDLHFGYKFTSGFGGYLYSDLDSWQDWMRGRTVNELIQLTSVPSSKFMVDGIYVSSTTSGRPVHPDYTVGSDTVAAVDVAKWNALTDAQKADLEKLMKKKAKVPSAANTAPDFRTDGTTGATISLHDNHGHILYAIADAWEKRAPLYGFNIGAANKIGLGRASNGRKMGNFGTFIDGTTPAPVYTFNEVYAGVILDAGGRIMATRVDALEVSSPNYDGPSMPHFSGWYSATVNQDTGMYPVSDHNGAFTDGVAPTSASFTAEVEGWITKRGRGDAYIMTASKPTTSVWYKEMDIFEKFFAGKTPDEISTWVSANTTAQGRPNPATMSSSDADALSGATMSLNDAHGNIVKALQKAAYPFHTQAIKPLP
jgi:hypothetical protein